jgi:hypothetical protein
MPIQRSKPGGIGIDLRRSAALPQDAPTLSFGATAPDAFLLAHCESVLETSFPHRALSANVLGHVDVVVIVGRVEDHGV